MLTTPYPDSLAFGYALGYLTPQQAAAHRGCSSETIRRYIKSGALPVHFLDQRTRLIAVKDIDALHLHAGWGR